MQPDKDIIPSDMVYVKDRLTTITEHKDTRFQVCAVMRYGQASQYHYFDLQLKEQIRVRQDLIGIDKLLEECNYILDNDIKDVNQAKEKLDAVKQEIKAVKELKSDKAYSDEDINVDDLGVKKEYEDIYRKLINARAEMTDEEYESLSDRLEEIETEHPELVRGGFTAASEYDKKLEMLYAEKRILSRIVKEADITESVVQRPPVNIVHALHKMPEEKEREENVTESVTPKGGM